MLPSGYQHAFNQRLTLQLGVDAMKINMIHSTGQAFSTSGALRYQASDRVAFKVFGSYAIGNTYGMDTHRYGATMSLDMSERFGYGSWSTTLITMLIAVVGRRFPL